MSETDTSRAEDSQRVDEAHTGALHSDDDDRESDAAVAEVEALTLDDEREDEGEQGAEAAVDDENDSEGERSDAEESCSDNVWYRDRELQHAGKDDNTVPSQAVLDLINGMMLPAQRQQQAEFRRALPEELLQAMRHSLPDHALLDANVCGLVADYLDDPHQHRRTFLPRVRDYSYADPSIKTLTSLSKFNGYPYLLPGEEWPRCDVTDECTIYLTFLLQLRVDDFPAVLRSSLTPPGATGSTLFQCFYCNKHGQACAGLDQEMPGQLLRWVHPVHDEWRYPEESDSGVPSSPGSVWDKIYSWRPTEHSEFLLRGWQERLDWPHTGAVWKHFLATQAAASPPVDDSEQWRRWQALSVHLPAPVLDVKLSGFQCWRKQHLRFHSRCKRCKQERQLLIAVSVDCQLFAGHRKLEDGSLIVLICPQHRDSMKLVVDKEWIYADSDEES